MYENINIEDFDGGFDMIYLPSRGLFYSNKTNSLLIKYLTSREEKVLTSPSLIESGVALEMILKSCIIEKEIDINSLLVADKDAIILFLRSTAYGDKIPLQFKCTNCGSENDTDFRISSLEMKDNISYPNEKGELEFTLPITKSNVKIKPLTVADEKVLEQKLKSKRRYFYGVEYFEEVTERYALQIVEINGKTDKSYINKFIKSMPIKDSTALREFVENSEPGIDKNIKLSCSNCHTQYKDTLRITPEFLGVTPDYRKNLDEEIFLVWYYSRGGITRDQAIKMSVADRKYNIQRISEEIEKKNKAEEEAAKKAKSNKGGASSRF